MIGLNTEILSSYVEYITNIRVKALGLTEIFTPLANPLPWMNAWLVSDNVQVAPQEAEISSYLVGAIDSDLGNSDFNDFDL
jgi:ribonucleoside-diphosphate reductase beta chain